MGSTPTTAIMSEIWTPKGLYRTSDHPDIERMNQVAKMYDPELSVAVNPDNGDICLFSENPNYYRGKQILFGWDHVPTDDELQARLYRTDMRRHGDKILTDAWKKADEVKKESQKEVDEATTHLAEVIEFEYRER